MHEKRIPHLFLLELTLLDQPELLEMGSKNPRCAPSPPKPVREDLPILAVVLTTAR